MDFKEFQFHVDSAHLRTKFSEPVYVTVKYVAERIGSAVKIIVIELSLGPTVAKDIISYPSLVKDIDDAAYSHALNVFGLTEKAA
jgi:hypothetical protein